MGDKTAIEWTDATWNPIRGCSRVSEGCRHCYAETVANRFKGKGQPYEGLIAKGGQWNGKIAYIDDLIDQPLRWRRARRIFVNSMSDLFHENVPVQIIDRVFAVMAIAERHTFQVLTKRPERMREYLSQDRREEWAFWAVTLWGAKDPDALHDAIMDGDKVLPNVWLGVSVEDQKAADERIPHLLATPAAVRWISAEPLLGPVDVEYPESLFPNGPQRCCSGHECSCMGQPVDPPLIYGINWVVVGGESGPHARPMHPEWARGLRDQCAARGVPFLFKQWGEWAPMVGAVDGWALDDDPEQSRFDHCDWEGDRWSEPYRPQWCDELDDDTVSRIGKKRAGRLLDGMQHDGYPEAR